MLTQHLWVNIFKFNIFELNVSYIWSFLFKILWKHHDLWSYLQLGFRHKMLQHWSYHQCQLPSISHPRFNFLPRYASLLSWYVLSSSFFHHSTSLYTGSITCLATSLFKVETMHCFSFLFLWNALALNVPTTILPPL